MVRTPCCENMGMKKGPWTPEEDQILISYIQQQGNGNWRALPRQAGLLRCGKSCRLRWTNYLRPDIKRGNFSEEEQETIIKLNQIIGNRWSAIAARLPGRTDNEIKNYWHTHLKRRFKQTFAAIPGMKCTEEAIKLEPSNYSSAQFRSQSLVAPMFSPRNSLNLSSDSSTKATSRPIKRGDNIEGSTDNPENDYQHSRLSSVNSIAFPSAEYQIPTPSHSATGAGCMGNLMDGGNSSKMSNDMAFWYNLFIKAGES